MFDKETGLTTRQMAFAEAYAIEPNAGKAYDEAGYKSNGNQRIQGYKLLQKPKILDYINDIKQKTKVRTSILHDITRQEIIDNARWLIDDGKKNNRPTSVAKGNEQLGKIAGVFTETLNFNDVQQQRDLDEKEKAEADKIAAILIRDEVAENNLASRAG